jgi:hypothetical protein
MLREFPGYTLTTLYQEDADLLRMYAIERLGTPEGGDDDGE